MTTSITSTATSTPSLKLKRILAPIDFSADSEKAQKYALRLAQQFGAQVVLLHVTEPLAYTGDYMPPDAMANWDASALQKANEKITAAEKALAAAAGERTITADTAVRTGIAHDEIVQAAQTLEADLIVISTHGRTGLRHILMGSTAERVVRHAPCPVFVVRAKEHDFVA